MDDEDSRNARRGRWILRRHIFDRRVRHLGTILGPILRKHLFSYRVDCLEKQLGFILDLHLCVYRVIKTLCI